MNSSCNPVACGSPSPAASRVGYLRRAILGALVAGPFLAAQNPLDVKPAPQPDPIKGWHDMSPMSPEERALLRNPRRTPAGAVATAPGGVSRMRRDRVLFDQPGDDRVWAVGANYKASFGADGFVFVPFFGHEAPRNFPVQFQLHSVRVGGQQLALPDAQPEQIGNRVQFARGAVVEQYDLELERVEQTFVIDSAAAGDVEVELRVASELVDDAARDGLQFRNEFGSVDYGVAHVVNGTELIPVPTTFADQTIRIRVPASLRTGDRLVIDPIIHSSTTALTANQPEFNPDIAYDASLDQYLVVWQSPVSLTDSDLWAERRNGDGTQIVGSVFPLDITTNDVTLPRVANLNAFNRYLIVYQLDPPTGATRIFGRVISAGGAVLSGQFPVSDASVAGNCYNPDIGGDPSDQATGNQWLVVWEREASATDSDIHGRLVRHDTATPGTTIFIENTANTIFTRPSVSKSNGNGLVASPCWMVAYDFRFSATDYDIHAAALSQSSLVTPSTPISSSSANEWVPDVSSPATDFGGVLPLFMLGYQRSASNDAHVRLLRPSTLGIFINELSPVANVTALLGTTGAFIQCESDGNRFAVIVALPNAVATLAFTGTQLVANELPQTLPGLPAFTRLVSKRSSGGPRTNYAIVDEDRIFTPSRIRVIAYRGHAPGNGLSSRPLACNGLGLDTTGRPFLGDQVTFTLTNTGTDIPGFVFGSPVPASSVLCLQCPLGVDPSSAILVIGTTLAVPIPLSASFVGAQFAVQGLGLGSGPCVASLHFSNVIDVTVQ
jgi:hypothetical protein